MAKDKTPAEAEQDRGELVQVKIFLPEKDLEALKKHSKTLGISHNIKARLIIIDYLDNLKFQTGFFEKK
jgi:hypothetical protein